MLKGEAINNTENRAVLHTVLRVCRKVKFMLNGENIAADVHSVLAQMRSFSDAVREGRWLGYTGKPIRTIINIGIGGSDLGPQMAHRLGTMVTKEFVSAFCVECRRPSCG